MIGRELVLGRYALFGVLGRGGMAEVRDGWDTRLTRQVAVKLLHPALSCEAHFRRRFEDEARSAASLSHPNIVAVYDFGEHRGNPFIVLERLPGRTLADLIGAGPMPVQHVRSMLDDVLAGLGAAHNAGMLHRDVKPGNILVSATGDAMKVADFGIAKTVGTAHTTTGQIVGTMSYLSPQRLAGEPASVGDDLYAVGLMAYEALVGRPAFRHDDAAAMAGAIMNTTLPPVAAVRSDVDPILAAVVDRAMTRNPLQRFASADQMRAALAGDRQALIGPAAVSRPPTKVLEHPVASAPYVVPPPRRHRRPTARRAVFGALALVALVVSVLALASDPPASAPAQEPVVASTAESSPTVVPPAPVPSSEPVQADTPPGPGHGPGKGPKKHP
ncbi:serine/threonine-protein kinase [Mycolicibacterium sp. CBM1]